MSITANLARTALSALAVILASCGSPEPAATETAAPAPSESASAVASASVVEPAAVTEATPASKPVATRDPIRGKGGLEERCLKEVARQGTTVIGTNRIEESQTVIDIYVNVVDGQAPWRCRGNRDGKIESVEYSGSEGAL